MGKMTIRLGDPAEVPCPTCDGSGKRFYPEDEQCLTCGGQGALPADVIARRIIDYTTDAAVVLHVGALLAEAIEKRGDALDLRDHLGGLCVSVGFLRERVTALCGALGRMGAFGDPVPADLDDDAEAQAEAAAATATQIKADALALVERVKEETAALIEKTRVEAATAVGEAIKAVAERDLLGRQLGETQAAATDAGEGRARAETRAEAAVAETKRLEERLRLAEAKIVELSKPTPTQIARVKS